jgi:hypothetical protein
MATTPRTMPGAARTTDDHPGEEDER